MVIPFAAYLPADRLGLSGVLAAVTAGLVIGGRLGTILTPSSRLLWLTTWKMIGFVLNGFLFVLIGLELPSILDGLGDRPPSRDPRIGGPGQRRRRRRADRVGVRVEPAARIAASADRATRSGTGHALDLRRELGRTARRRLAGRCPRPPVDFPERDLILFVTFSVILVTLVGQGLTLPRVLRWARWDGIEPEGDEATRGPHRRVPGRARGDPARPRGVARSSPLFDRLESGLQDRTRHLATEDADETEERRQERVEHEEIQRGVIGAQRTAVIELRDRGEINDLTLRVIERELDLEELRMEG